MLAQLEEQIPRGAGWRYEPKWDGFRAVVFRDQDSLQLQSRNGQPLQRYFPELVESLAEALPERCVLDGEIIVPGPNGLDFDALLQRIHPAASRVKLLAAQTPSSFVAFDLLALADEDLRARPFDERRRRLERAVPGTPRVFVTPQTDNPATAESWFTRFEGAGLDGVVAKRADLLYVEGERVMVREHEHVGGEPEPRGLRGEEAEGRERIVVARAAHRGHGVRDRDVLAAGHVVVAEVVGSDGDARDLGGPRLRFPFRAVIRVAGDDRRDQAEAHPGLLPRSRLPRQQREPLDGTSRRARRSRSIDPGAA